MLFVLISIISIVNNYLLKIDIDQVYDNTCKKVSFLYFFQVLRFLLR